MKISNRIVTEDEADLRLDRWFRRHYPNLTQGALQKLCRKGQIRVDGGRVQSNARLAPGQSVRIPPLPDMTRQAPLPPPDPMLVREIEKMVIYQDDHLLVLDKPSGLAT
ncbi:MAG: S4 domain-containing protein, partial [Gluconobacter sp.]